MRPYGPPTVPSLLTDLGAPPLPPCPPSPPPPARPPRCQPALASAPERGVPGPGRWRGPRPSRPSPVSDGSRRAARRIEWSPGFAPRRPESREGSSRRPAPPPTGLSIGIGSSPSPAGGGETLHRTFAASPRAARGQGPKALRPKVRIIGADPTARPVAAAAFAAAAPVGGANRANLTRDFTNTIALRRGADHRDHGPHLIRSRLAPAPMFFRARPERREVFRSRSLFSNLIIIPR